MADGNSAARALRVAIVGSGPSGFYAAEALLKAKDGKVSVDMLDRLPFPYGLVRGGVAPDHQKIKSVIAVYEKTAASPDFRFFGNIKLGTDVSVDELKRHYDCIVYAVGNESDRKLGIPGEELEGSRTATEFVGWYNGHPDFRDRRFDLSCERAAVVGIGNVAMDVTRILARDPESLAGTDIAGYALEALRKSKVREIIVFGRRGPLQAAFSPKEIKEIAELAGSDLIVRPEEAELDAFSREEFAKGVEVPARQNVEFLLEQAKRGEGANPKKVRLRLLASPVELLGEGGKVAAVRIERNALSRGEDGELRARGTGRFETFPVGLVFRSVGYFGVPIPGVSFDAKKGRIPNEGGRVRDGSGAPLPGEYVVGWAKRGPSGLIGTNRADSAATVEALLADWSGKTLGPDPDKSPAAAEAALRARKPELIGFEDWKRLDRLETRNGKARGKIREKFSSVAEALAALEQDRRTA